MEKDNIVQEWVNYREQARLELVPALEKKLGCNIDYAQPHLQGERYLMGAHKLVLLGRRGQKRVVVKASNKKSGIKEIEQEHLCRETLKKIDFAYHVFHIPEELWWGHVNEWTVAITEYIEQPAPFLGRPLGEQFSLALRAFKLQESVHATTYAHAKIIRKVFGFWGAATYTRSFSRFRARTHVNAPHITALSTTIDRAQKELVAQSENIERYCGFLTHADFALQNLRITKNDMYLIDLASLRFGNKFESWARFLNFALLYNRPLEHALTQYVKDNRSEEEQSSLRLMRIYKLGELLAYHARAYANSEGDLKHLSETRLVFWTRVLTTHLDTITLKDGTIEEYKKTRDSLRSGAEKHRQKELQQF